MPIWRKNTDPNALYEERAADYERHAGLSFYNVRYERPAMFELIGDVDGLHVLDAGCAGGAYAAAFSSRGASVLAVDRSAAMIALVEQKGLPNVSVRVHDLADPMTWAQDASVDLIVSSLAMHYVASWETPLAEFYRILRPGGRLVISVHHPAITRPLVENYFPTQCVTETWKVNGSPVEVTYFHRPIETIVNDVIAARFQLTRLVEPHLQEAPGMNEQESRLARNPWFLILEARKPR